MKPPVSRLLSAFGIALLLPLGVLGCGGSTKTVTVTVHEEGGGATESAEEREPSEAVAPPEGGLGDTLVLPDEYEANGNSKDDELAWTLKALDEDATPDGNPYSIKEAEKGGNKLVRAQFTVKQEAGTESGSITPTAISAIDDEGQAYTALSTEIFSPELFPSSAGDIALAPGEQRQGYVAFAVPSSAKIEKVEVKDSGFTAPDLAIWTVH
jgi:hypothetical protein